MRSTTEQVGERNSHTDLVVTVGFAGTTKGYDYFVSHKYGFTIEPGSRAQVIVRGAQENVAIRSVRASTACDRLKRVALIQRTRADKEPEQTFTNYVHVSTPQEPKTMFIKITNQTLINGRELKHYSDHELLDLLRNTDTEIATLSQLDPIPKRFQKKIDELKASKAELLELLDSVEPKED
ncbi:MAG TPA: hypothetical protein PKZ27_03105 [Rhodocyclaceae bacterium]|nr:hypothetical protein [Rhodocyclaceae bacterium]